MQRYYVYELINPITQTVFYVGRGVGNRYQSHWKYLNPNESNDAFLHECLLIKNYGTSYDGTGILSNLTKGGDGGDTISCKTKEEKRQIYEKKMQSERENGAGWEDNRRIRQSLQLKKHWQDNREMRLEAVSKSMKTRDRINHATAVSNGWHNRSDDDKQDLSVRRSKIQKDAWTDPVKKEKLLNGTRAITIPTLIIKPDGEEIVVDSLRNWCIENNHSYAVLDDIRSGRHIPKTKRSRYYEWRISKND